MIGGVDEGGVHIQYPLGLKSFDKYQKVFQIIEQLLPIVITPENQSKNTPKGKKRVQGKISGKGKKKERNTVPFTDEESIKLIQEVELRPGICNFLLPLRQRTEDIIMTLWKEVGEKFAADQDKTVYSSKSLA